METQEIKSLVPASCPFCQKPIIAAFKMSAPQLTGILTAEIVGSAKIEAVRRVGELDVPQEQKDQALGWINSPDVLFGPEDIEELISNIKQNNGNITEA